MELNNNKTAPIVQEMDKNQLSLDLMHRMRLTGMATAFEESLTTTIADTMTPDGFLSTNDALSYSIHKDSRLVYYT